MTAAGLIPVGRDPGKVAPALYWAEVRHDRRERVRHSFRHRIYLWLVDLDDLPRLPAVLRPFARFEARDHLGSPEASIRANLDAWLAEKGVDLAGGRVLMLASARVLGHVFNPISVFWCYRSDGSLACVVAEVHNTYGGRHAYLLRPDESGRAELDKEFYVSPFLPVRGRYLFRVSGPGPRVSLTIAVRQDGRTPLLATLRAGRRPVTIVGVVRMLVTRPLVTRWVALLIRRHGVLLWLRRVPVVSRRLHLTEEGGQ
ncbi:MULTISPECIES: DUF1365 domain-containing protein [Actinoalloteichus]|uniref:DUF1365 domain-containing protein n=1 Tax=Actinoalloteichus fjordicus TaxID=1612552 RepID=A0AAC9PTL2_9PSEU|nr:MULTISPECIES: DUF1365 domain-containing protein [Actinoalloteichus]APU16268.1 hypothetical protein UA74_21215 [Actinoalloteichus fjordicus]APU22328.1 hypothetical protein UA75_21695 [Actinoalloteichus sp. GBA129-24]